MITHTSDKSFYKFCKTLEQVRRLRRPKEQNQVLHNYFSSLDPDIEILARKLAFVGLSGERVTLGHRLLAISASEYCGIDYDRVFRPCHKAMGNIPATIGKLIGNIDLARDKATFKNYSINEIFMFHDEFLMAYKNGNKKKFLDRIWSELSPVEIPVYLTLLKRGVIPSMIAQNMTGTNQNSIFELVTLLYVRTDFGAGNGLPTVITVGAPVNRDDRLEPVYVPLGTISQVLEESMVSRLIENAKPRISEKFGPVYMLEPSLIVEVAFEGWTKNSRTKAGVSMINPQLIEIHENKNPDSCKSLDELIRSAIVK